MNITFFRYQCVGFVLLYNAVYDSLITEGSQGHYLKIIHRTFKLNDCGSGIRLNEDSELKHSSVGWCLVSLAGPTMHLLGVFFSSDCLYM